MKLYSCIFGILFTLTLAKCDELADAMAEYKRIKGECVKEIGVTEEFVEKNPDDPKTKCFLACSMKKEGTMVNGKVVIDILINGTLKLSKSEGDKAKFKVLMTECANKANEEKEECGVAGTLTKCFMEKINSDQEY